MSPTWVNGVGYVTLERPGVKRLSISARSKDPKFVARCQQMIDRLYDPMNRLDILHLLVRKQLDLHTALYHYERHQLEQLPSAEGLRPLSIMREWHATLRVSATYNRDCRRTIDRLLREFPDASIGDVPDLLKRLRKDYADRPSGYNHTRSHLLAFLRDTVGERHQLYQDIKAVKALSAPRQRQPLVVKPAEARRIVKECRYGAEIWSLFVTGMRWKEYTVDGWEVVAERPRHVAIRGQKRAGRVRAVPLIDTPTPPTCSEKTAIRALQEARPGMILSDCRNTYRVWLENAGVEPSRIKIYCGWSPKGMMDLYAWRDIRDELEEDAVLVRAYLGLDTEGRLEVVK